jgi:hypothetical protein
MNRKQEIFLWAGLIVVQLMIFFPPISRPHNSLEGAEVRNGDTTATFRIPGYGIIIRDHENIRFGLLAAQLIIVFAVTGGLIYKSREKESKEYGH